MSASNLIKIHCSSVTLLVLFSRDAGRLFTMVVVEAIGVHSAPACEVRCSTVVATGQEGPAVKAEAIATYL